MNDDPKARVREQFGRAAERYAVSVVHAKGASLQRLVELAEPRPDDLVLDVATATGHTALALAPHVAQVVGTDLTEETLAVARRLAQERGITNVEFRPGDAEALPFSDDQFDLVTCRVALHHFPNPQQGVDEMARVCKPGGRVILVDNVVPEDEEVAAFINQFEVLRDPSHHRAYPISRLVEFFEAADLRVTHTETLAKPIEFYDWTWRMSVAPDVDAHLHDLLLGSEGGVREFFEPVVDGEEIWFNLHEGIVVGWKIATAGLAESTCATGS